MLLETHKELLQHIGETVIFSHIGRLKLTKYVGRLFLDNKSDYESIYLLNDSLNGRLPFSEEWKDYGYKHSWIISNSLNHYEVCKQDIVNIHTISMDYNKLEEILC